MRGRRHCGRKTKLVRTDAVEWGVSLLEYFFANELARFLVCPRGDGGVLFGLRAAMSV